MILHNCHWINEAQYLPHHKVEVIGFRCVTLSKQDIDLYSQNVNKKQRIAWILLNIEIMQRSRLVP